MSKKYYKYLIILFLIIFSFFPTSYLIKKGFINGHDTPFHYAQVYDLFNAWSHKSFINYISYDLNNGLGMGTKLFYAPLSHMLVVLFYFPLSLFSATLTTSYKFVIYLSILISGIFTYLLGKKMTNNEYISLVIAIIYMLFPYRYSVIYTRNAFAEGIAMTFIPLVFLGTYDLLKMKEFKLMPFIELILGLVLCFLTHNITFIFTLLFALIFTLFHFKDLIAFLRKKENSLTLIMSGFLMFLYVCPLLLPMLDAKNSGLYRIFNKEAMRTGLNYILDITKKTSLSYLTYHINPNFKQNFWFFLLMFLPLTCMIIFPLKLKNKIAKYISFFASVFLFIICFIVSLIYENPGYLYLILFLLFNLFLLLIFVKKRTNFHRKREYFFEFLINCFLLIFTLILILNTNIWKYLPSFLYNVQFPWRLWSFIGLFLALTIGLFLNFIDSFFKFKITIFLSCLIISISVLLIYPTNSTPSWDYGDKNIIYDEKENKRPEYRLIDQDSTFYIYASGWQLEYFTNEWWDGPKSSFWWKCYNTMKDPNNQNYIEEVYFVRKKAGNLINYTYSPKEIIFEIEMNQLSEIEIPRVYYKGYEITIKTADGVKHLDYYQKEGFITIKTDLSGIVCVKYVGTIVEKLGFLACYCGILFGIVGINFYYYITKKKSILLNYI